MFNFKLQAEEELFRVNQLLSQLPEISNKPKGYVVKHASTKGTTYSLCEIVTDSEGKRYKTTKFLGDESSQELQNEKNLAYVYELRKRLAANSILLERIIKTYKSFNEESINSAISAGLRDIPFRGVNGYIYPKTALFSWANQPYETNPFPREQNHYSISGKAFRSKAEVIIANSLDFYGIPYRCEEKIILKNKDGFKETRYPDFTIITPSGKKIYWEHFGMLKKSDYSESTGEKLHLYALNDIILWKNLIVSIETKDGEIDNTSITFMIQSFIMKHF